MRERLIGILVSILSMLGCEQTIPWKRNQGNLSGVSLHLRIAHIRKPMEGLGYLSFKLLLI